MRLTCIVVGCGSRADRDKLSFFAVPKEKHFKHAIHLNKLSAERRLHWIKAIKRNDLTDNKLKYERLCSKHFISEKPAALEDDNSDWVPSQNMGYITSDLKRQCDLERSERVKTRRLHKEVVDKENIRKLSQEKNTIVPDSADRELNLESGTSTQTDVTGNDFVRLHKNLSFASIKVEDMSRRFNKMILTFETLKNDKKNLNL